MEYNNKLALFVAYFLSRFNDEAYKDLGYKTQVEAHRMIGEILKVNPNTIMNMRDEFDPLHGHRLGWYQRPLAPSRVQVYNALIDLSMQEVSIIVKDILGQGHIVKEDEIAYLTKIIDEKEIGSNYILRGPTGKKAEEYFIRYHRDHKKPFAGELIDTRENGCGYDFEIKAEGAKYYIEVKGAANKNTGILFTNKEWETAKKHGDNYYVVFISNLDDTPSLEFIQSPYEKLNPNKNIVKTVQITWTVSDKEIKKIL